MCYTFAPGGSRTGGFCTATDEIGICSQSKIRLDGKEAKVYKFPSRRSDSGLVNLLPLWISHGSYRHYTGSYTGHCKMQRWIGYPRTPSNSACTGA